MESHEHKMDPEHIREIVDMLVTGQDDEGYDAWDSVLSIETFRTVRITLGVGGPTRWLDISLDAEGDVTHAEYVDSWAVPNTYELWSDDRDRCQEIVDSLGIGAL